MTIEEIKRKTRRMATYVALLVFICTACTVSVQVMKNNENSSFTNSTETSGSADSASVDVTLK